ncbi:MAG TPA: prolyl oligopeptidase family serine peptidase, partial [Caulobacteraceae bacterium]
MIVRPATLDDAPVLAALYAHHVIHGTGTFEEAPPSPEDIAGRIVAYGGSAGGMLMGAVANMRPDLWAGIIAAVP